MIDMTEEKLVRLKQVPDLPWLDGAGQKGGKLKFETAYKWARVGLKGIKLETVRVGGNLCTTEAALLRFFERVKTPQGGQEQVTTSQRNASKDRANKLLDALGI